MKKYRPAAANGVNGAAWLGRILLSSFFSSKKLPRFARMSAKADPTLVEQLFELDQSRMHLTALALAYLSSEVTPDLALMLLQGSRKTILNLSVGHRPVGIDRMLSHLPPKVLTAESYRKLTDLLLVPATAKFLHHRTSITEQIITGLHTLPAALRSAAIMSMFSPFGRMLLFVDGLRFLASRTGLPFESLANQIGPVPARPSRRKNNTASRRFAFA